MKYASGALSVLGAAAITIVIGRGCTSPTANVENEAAAAPSPATPLPATPVEPATSSIPTVIYDNDDVVDVYTDDFMMALADAGDVELVGMITSSSVAPFNEFVTSVDNERAVARREMGVRLARESGLDGIPDPVRGPARQLIEPPSRLINDTEPIDSEGSRLILNAVRSLAPGDTLRLVMGGPLTAVADAYLLDPSIAARILVLWLGGRPGDMGDYNGWADPWAAHIVLERIPLVIFLAQETGKASAPRVTKSRLRELPSSPLRDWMIAKQHPTNPLPNNRDGDSPPALALVRPDYIARTHRVEPDGWATTKDGRSVPAFRSDPGGRATVVTSGHRDVATEAWWHAVEAALDPTGQAQSDI